MKPYALVDRREPYTRVQQLEYEGFRVDVPAENLESGDVILIEQGKTVGIEVKTAAELVSLVPSGISQLVQFQRMATFDSRVLLIVGTLGYQNHGAVLIDGWNKRSDMKYAAIQGALFNLQANLGFLVRHVAKEQEIGRAVWNIHEYFSKEHVLLAKPRPLTLSAPHASGLAVLMTLPGIGAVQAERILQEHGSLWKALDYVPDWQLLPGIGPKTCTAVETFLKKNWYADVAA